MSTLHRSYRVKCNCGWAVASDFALTEYLVVLVLSMWQKLVSFITLLSDVGLVLGGFNFVVNQIWYC